jgi:cyclase
LEELRVLGKPERFARYYYENRADELIYMDAVASLYGWNSLLDIVERTSREIFIPLTVGGGLRSVDDIRTVLRAGADKISLNTAAIRRPELVREASKAFGSSTIVVSIETIKMPNGTYEAYNDFGGERNGLDAFKWAVRALPSLEQVNLWLLPLIMREQEKDFCTMTISGRPSRMARISLPKAISNSCEGGRGSQRFNLSLCRRSGRI